MILSKAIAWAIAHPDAAAAYAALAVALLRALYALLSRLVQPYPRLRAAVEAIAALGPDVARAGLQGYRALTGRPVPSLDLDARDAEIAALRARVAELAASRVDTGAPLVGRPGGSPGRASVGAMVALALGATAALLLMAAALPGCPSVIHEPAVAPPPGACVRGATACHLGTPFRCGPDGWSQADRRCGGLGTDAAQVVCCTTPSALRPGATVAACVPPSACVGEVSP